MVLVWKSCFRKFQSVAPFYRLQVNYNWQHLSWSRWCFMYDRRMSETSSDVDTRVFRCAFQSPTARRCGWWCLWCACRWWPSPFSSLSSSAPWDTTAVCRAPRVRAGAGTPINPPPLLDSPHYYQHVNLSVAGGDLRRFAQIMQIMHPNFFLLIYWFFIYFLDYTSQSNHSTIWLI